MSIEDFVRTLNEYGSRRLPFLCLVDFEMQKPLVFRIEEISPEKILYAINGQTNCPSRDRRFQEINFLRRPPAITEYEKKFRSVSAHLAYGDSYLTNLTIKTEVITSHTLKDIFFSSQAKYKLWFDDQFLVFSPETFVKMEEGVISAFPMKGTIDASVPDAEKKILSDAKEMAEHVTIVDLIRNDLSSVAEKVEVARFRYVEQIATAQKNLLQVSSEIRGALPPDYRNRLGTILAAMLPAGSICGAPKRKTLEIIRTAEMEGRGYYTGIVGLFDGSRFDSGVMIRFIEKSGGRMYYRSGGGITALSVMKTEYQEAIDKVYVPLD